MSWFRNDRGDYAVLRVVLLLLVLVAPVALTVTVASSSGDRTVEWQGDIAGLELDGPVVPAADGASITYADTAEVEVRDPSPGLWWLAQLPDLALALAVSTVAWVLVALLVLTIAEAFEHGARLSADVEGLV